MRPGAPLWLAQPSRFAALTRGQARWALALITLLLLASLTALNIPDASDTGRQLHDPMLYDGVVDGVRHGGDYYTVAADALREAGQPLRPFAAIRLPTLAEALALAPEPARRWLAYVLAAAVLLAWAARLRPAFAHAPARWVAVVLLAAGLVGATRAELATSHELWAGLFIALSIVRRRPGRWLEPVAWGLCALLIRETALPFVGVMALFAALEGERRELVGWGCAVALFAGVLALHAHAVSALASPGPTVPGGLGLLGFGFFVSSLALATGLVLLPMGVAAPMVALALVGWSAWRDPLALRMLCTLALYAALIGVAAGPDAADRALTVAPAALVGLAFAPDALRDLLGAALDARRITVTRVTR